MRLLLDSDHPYNAGTALRLAGALTPFWKTRGYFREGQEWLRRALEANPDGPSAFRARALFGLAMLATMRGEVSVARDPAEKACRSPATATSGEPKPRR